NDELIALFVCVTGAALFLAPRRHGVTSTGGLALTTTVRVVNRVHDDTTDGRADTLPAHAAGLAPVDVRLLCVADLADRRAAASIHVADLTGRQTKLRVRAVLGDETNGCSGRACHLGTPAWLQLDRVDDGTDRDVLERQVVARLDVGARTGLDDVTLLQLVWSDDVPLGAVHEVQERDARRAVRVVLDLGDLGVHAVLVIATEVDDAVLALVATTDVTGRDASGVVAATGLRQRTKQRLLRGRARDLGKVCNRRTTATRGRGLVLTNSHCYSLCSLADSREDVDRAGLERHDGALGVLALASAELGATSLALLVQGVDRGDLDAEDLLDRQLDLGLVRAGVHLEGVLALVDEAVALLGDDGRQDDVARILVRGGHALTFSFLLAAFLVLASAALAGLARSGLTRFLLCAGAASSVLTAAAGPATKPSSAPLVKTMSSLTRTSYALSWS